ncbi:MAG: hypothetical protein A2539_01080 [Elusimicrobia bacterium RIFOXYD2_FULL_34_15]|nr:MAG: hypothetical protein A2539_01080 [Elusimicrobia bacterium RIFOXYD2_FULL_34_15]
MKFKIARFVELKNTFYFFEEISGVKKIIIIIFLFICFTAMSSAKESAPLPDFIYNSRTVDAKAIGMGEAFVAVCNNASVAYWNPAGLKFLDRRYFTTSINIRKDTKASSEDLFIADSLKGKKLVFLGLTGSRKAISYIPLTDYTGTFENKDIEIRANKYVFSSANQYSSDMTMGVNINYISATLGVIDRIKPDINISDGNGLSVDLGFLYTYYNPIRLGLNLENFPGYIWWNDYKTQKLKPRLRTGLSTRITDWLLVSADYENVYSIKEEFYHYGLQQTVSRHMYVREGLVSKGLFKNSDDKYVTFGLGYEISILQIDLANKIYKLNNANKDKVNDYVLSLSLSL